MVAESVQKTIEVIAPTKSAWLNFRKQDVRYDEAKQKFLDRLYLKDPFIDPIQASKVLMKITVILMETDTIIYLSVRLV